MDNLSISYPYWFIILCLLLGLVYSGVLYYRDRKYRDTAPWVKWLMAALRFLAVSGIAFLLLSPMIKSITEDIKKPIVVIGEDQSESIAADMDSVTVDAYQQSINNLADQLSEKYEVRRMSFGDEVIGASRDSFSDKVTNISAAMDYINDNYADQNLGAVILSTDGIFNEGKNPLYTSTAINAPIYSIALGDTTVRKDLTVSNVFHNKIAYLNDQFIIQVDASVKNLKGNATRMTVSKITDNGKIKQHEETIRINDDDFFTSKNVKLSADDIGVIKYRISLSPVANEVSTSNNYKDIYVEILDARQKILLYADGPHPDLAALKEIITTNKNYEVDIKYAQDQNIEFAKYDLVTFHNLPSKNHKIDQALTILNRRKTPRLFIVGGASMPNALNSLQDAITYNGNTNLLEDVQADILDNFSDFVISEDLKKMVGRYPPLKAPFGEYKAAGQSKVLLNQTIKKIETKAPLLAFSNVNDINTAVWVGEGIWRWKLYNYLQEEDIEEVTELVNKSIQLIAKKDDKRKFRVNHSNNIYKENENILLDAQLYNTSYEMVNDPDVSLVIKDQDGKRYNFTFSRTADYYTLNARKFPEGNYAYTAEVTYNGEKMTDKGRFSVKSIQLESYDLTARHDILQNLSDNSGGNLVYPDSISSIYRLISTSNSIKPVVYQSSKTMSLLNYKWLFFLLVGLLILEWFLRRYMGEY